MTRRRSDTGGITTVLKGVAIRRALLALLSLVFLLVMLPSPSASADALCKEVPAPVRPDYQVAGWIMDKPNMADVPDKAPDPFTDTAVPISDVYGWAWRFTTFDLGCGNDFVRDPQAVANTNGANIGMSLVTMLAASVDSIDRMARSSAFDWIEPVVDSVGAALRDRVLEIWLPLALVIVGVIIAVNARKAAYAETANRLAVVFLGILLAVITLVFPIGVTRLMDKAVVTVADAAQGGFGASASDVIARESLYKAWLIGNFGAADSPVAKEYGPRLMADLTYSWSEVKQMDADASAKKGIDKAKADDYSKLAKEIEKKDPAAYLALTGKSDSRVSAMAMSGMWVMIMGFFPAVASACVVLARLVMPALVVALMIGSVIGVLKFTVLQRMWDLFTAALLNVAKFTIAGGVMTIALAAVQFAPIGMGWRILVTLVLTVAAVMLTKPVASLKSMVGMDPSKKLLGGLFGKLGSAAIGAATGIKVADWRRDREADQANGDDQGPPARVWRDTQIPAKQQPVEASLPALPAPAPLYEPQSAHMVHQVPHKPSGDAWEGAEQFAERPSRRVLTISASEATQPALSGDTQTRPRRELVVGTIPSDANAEADSRPRVDEDSRLPDVWQRPTGEGVPSISQHGQDGYTETGPALPVRIVSSEGVATPVPGFAPVARPVHQPLVVPVGAMSSDVGEPLPSVGENSSGQPDPSTPRRVRPESQRPETAAVVYPAGVIVQHDPSLYRAGQEVQMDQSAREQYVRLPEPQLDSDGQETWEPMYHAPKARA